MTSNLSTPHPREGGGGGTGGGTGGPRLSVHCLLPPSGADPPGADPPTHRPASLTAAGADMAACGCTHLHAPAAVWRVE